MDEELGKRAHAVLMAALDRDRDERPAFLAEACVGDARLRGHVDELAAALTRSLTFLERSVLESRDGTPLVRSYGLPDAIPGYRILRVLGAGGMATVYEAEQMHPRRRVAFKVMRNGLAETSAIHRFRFETEVLARLQHPAIAQIYEAGTYDDGHGRSTPFFAMEYVAEAQTLTEYRRAQNLSLRERLRLFIDICDAVQHGHQHGVIHRDLKPANILVDGAGRPKVIDFGVARSSDADQAWITRDSDLGSLVGTLHYMSPEQCTAHAMIDVRADVYALGVVLYELIAGRVPHELSRVPIPEAIRIITQESPKPLGTIVPEARGDLNAIVSMATEKEPGRRYASVGALGADLRRFLNDQPIDARPATTLYQLRKFARRNRGMVVAAGVVFCTLLAGIASTSRMAIVARAAQRSAEARERELEQVTTFQYAQLSQIDVAAMGRRLRASLQQAIGAGATEGGSPSAVGRDAAELIAGVNFTTLASRMLDESVLQRSQDAIQRQFASQPLVRAKLLQRLAMTMYMLGLPARAATVVEEALVVRRAHLGDDHIDTLESMHLKGAALNALGRHTESAGVFRRLLEQSTRILGAEHEKTLLTATGLGGALRLAGDLDGAERIWEATLNTQRRVLGDDHPSTIRSLNNVAIMHALRGRPAEAEAGWRDVLERRRRILGPDHPDVRGSLGNLGLILQEQGKLGEAKPLLEEDLESARQSLGDDHPSTLESMVSLGALRLEMGDPASAEQMQRSCLEGRRRLFGADHPATWRAMTALADACCAAGCREEAEELSRAALASQREKLGPAHTDTIKSLISLSDVLRALNENAEAEAVAAEAVAQARRADDGQSPLLAKCIMAHGRALAALQRLSEAETALADSRGIIVSIHGADHPNARAIAEEIEYLRRQHPGP